MYNIPQTTGTYISRKVIEDLAELPTIVGLKDSSGNLPYTLEVLEKVRDKINVVIGHDEIVLPALAAGCSGMILASAQIFPEIWRRIYEAVVDKNDLVTARELQFQVQKLTRIFCRLGGPVPIKIALNLLGIKVGVTRAPLKVGGTLIHEDREEIRLELEKLGKLPVQNIDFELSSDQPLETRFEVIGLKPKEILTGQIRLGTGAAGEPNSPEAVRLDLVLGKKTTRLGEVFAEQLTHPRHGYEALTTIMEPNLTVRPSTLIVPQVALKNLRQANMIYGPTQAAVGKAVVDCIACGLITPDMVEDYVIIVSVFVHPQAIDRHLLYKNVYDAMVHALEEALKNI
jgi:formaldehyde-activating enzyme